MLRALDEKAAGKPEYRQDGKRVIFDEDISVNTVGNGSVRFEVSA